MRNSTKRNKLSGAEFADLMFSFKSSSFEVIRQWVSEHDTNRPVLLTVSAVKGRVYTVTSQDQGGKKALKRDVTKLSAEMEADGVSSYITTNIFHGAILDNVFRCATFENFERYIWKILFCATGIQNLSQFQNIGVPYALTVSFEQHISSKIRSLVQWWFLFYLIMDSQSRFHTWLHHIYQLAPKTLIHCIKWSPNSFLCPFFIVWAYVSRALN